MVKIKKNDLVELDFVGRIKDNRVFDTSQEDVAKKEGIFNPKVKYSPLVACVGQRQIIQGLDEGLIDKEVGKESEFVIPSEKGYGKRDAKLIRTVPMATFTKNKINPYPGMTVNAEGMMGVIKSVSGGRVMVDFNHPLAGRELVFNVKIIKIISDVKEKIKNLVSYSLFMREDMYKFEVKEGKLMFETSKDIPDFLKKNFENKVMEVIKDIKSIEFIKTEEKKTSTSA